VKFEHYIFGDFVTADRPLDASSVRDIFMRVDRASGQIQELPVEKIVEILDQVAVSWLDPGYTLRKIVLEKIPPIVGYSRQMAEAALDALFDTMKRDNLYKILRGHIGRYSALDRFEFVPEYDGYVKAQPLGVILHVSPGNVFVGGVDSLVYGFLSKNVNILKLSRQDPVFPLLFAKSLKEIDEGGFLSKSYAVLNFSGKDAQIEEIMKKSCDGIVVYGGSDAVMSYRQNLGLSTRLIEYGPKYSFSIITSEGFAKDEPEKIYKSCAYDVVMWEQRACSSPQVFYVEKDITGRFMDEFPAYLEEMSQKFPQENLPIDEKIEILKAREIARFEQATGSSVLKTSIASTSWTVIYEESPEFKISPLNRTIYIKPFTSWADVMAQVVKIKDYLQSVGVQVTAGQLKLLSRALARLGVSRISRVGKMWTQKPGAPHDFDFPLRRLVKWVTIDWIDERFDLGDKVAPKKVVISRWDRIRNLLEFARSNSVFYKDHFGELDVKTIKDHESFAKVPLLNKSHIYKNTPPVNERMLTAPLKGAYVFASGGSTGEPKFNFYSYRELDEVAAMLADIYQIAGLNKNDTVANLFMAGSLWTSFIVVNHALEKIGCLSLPIAGNADLDLVIRYMELFRPSAVVGLPSMIIRLAKEIKDRNLDLTIPKILYGGEHFSEDALSFFKETVKTEMIHSAGYASVDAGPIGYQCNMCSGGIHHLLYEYVYLEIIDPETGLPVPKGETGEITVTNLHRRFMPVIRYRTGDAGRMLTKECKCGHITPLFELMGRCDDVLRIGAMSIYPNQISESLGGITEITPLFRMIADYEGIKEVLTIEIEASSDASDRKKLAERVRNILLEKDPELELVIKEGWLGRLDVKVVPPGTLPTNPRTGKIIKVKDNRKRRADNG